MTVSKWDGVTDIEDILRALMLLIDEEDEAEALRTSYGDFGKHLQKLYKNSGAGNSELSVESFKSNLKVNLKKKGIAYSLTWNKAAKLIHQYLHGRNKNESI